MKVLVTGRLPEEVMAIMKKAHHVEAHGEDRPMERQRLLDMVGDKEGLLCMITDRIDGLVKSPSIGRRQVSPGLGWASSS